MYIRDSTSDSGNNLNFTVPRDIYSPPLTPLANPAISSNKGAKLYTTTLAPSPELLSGNVNSPILLPKKFAAGKPVISASMTQDPNDLHNAASSHSMPMTCGNVGITDPLFHSSDYFSLFCPNNSVLSQNQLIPPAQNLFMSHNYVSSATSQQGNTAAHMPSGNGLEFGANRAHGKDSLFPYDNPQNTFPLTNSRRHQNMPSHMRGAFANNNGSLSSSSALPESPDLGMMRAPLFAGSLSDISTYRNDFRSTELGGGENGIMGSSSVLLDANRYIPHHHNVEVSGETFHRDMESASAFQLPFDSAFMTNASSNFENNLAAMNGPSMNGTNNVLPHLNSQDIGNLGSCKYQCNHPGCTRSFEKLTQLRSHTKTHSMEKPYVCENCEMRFSRNHDLKRHQRIHSGVRPYNCGNCGKSFIRLDALSRHLKVNNGRGCKSRLKKD